MGLLEGKKGLILNIANDRSIATYIATNCVRQGAKCGFGYFPMGGNTEKSERRVRKAMEENGYADSWLHPCDVGSDESNPAEFLNFHFKADVMTTPGSNSGIFFHSQPEADWPKQGYESQVNNTQLKLFELGSPNAMAEDLRVPRGGVANDTSATTWVDMRGGVLSMYFDGKLITNYTETDPGTTLTQFGPAAGYGSSDSFNFIEAIGGQGLPDHLNAAFELRLDRRVYAQPS